MQQRLFKLTNMLIMYTCTQESHGAHCLNIGSENSRCTLTCFQSLVQYFKLFSNYLKDIYNASCDAI